MKFKPHEERVLEEFNQVNKRLMKLSAFLGSDDVFKLDKEDIKLLVRQELAMETYINVLSERIVRFCDPSEWLEDNDGTA